MKKRTPVTPIVRALEEAKYGAGGLLNLRDSMPTAAQAGTRAEAWLRERQALGVREVLVITGRGKGSEGGVAVVREEVQRVLGSLRRKGVVEDFSENGPGSFLVFIASLRSMIEAPRRNRRRTAPESTDGAMVDSRGRDAVKRSSIRSSAPSLAGLSSKTRADLQRLAELSLHALGAKDSRPFVESEMERHFTMLAASLPEAGDREKLFAAAVRRALLEYEDG